MKLTIATRRIEAGLWEWSVLKPGQLTPLRSGCARTRCGAKKAARSVFLDLLSNWSRLAKQERWAPRKFTILLQSPDDDLTLHHVIAPDLPTAVILATVEASNAARAADKTVDEADYEPLAAFRGHHPNLL